MAATKLNPAAPPFPCPYAFHFGPPPPRPMLPHHAGGSPPPSPPGTFFFCARFPVPSPYHPFFQFPVLQPQQALCKGVPAQPVRVIRKRVPPGKVIRKSAPAQPAKVIRKSVPEEATEAIVKCVSGPAPHGLAPHKLMVPGSAERKLQATGRQEPPPAAAAAPAQEQAAPGKLRLARRKVERRGRGKRYGYRQAAGPRSRARPRATSPPPAFLSKPLEQPAKAPKMLDSCTTVMVRNIPNRLKGDQMIAVLDEHCARANRAAGAVVSAYDVLYLPMDFRRRGNYGYAFVNFTTARGARGLYYSLQGCQWKVCGSGKIIDIVPAKFQGKGALVSHLSRHKFECATEEYLPAVFLPPRDGGAFTSALVTTRRVGRLVAPGQAAPPPPRHVKKAHGRVQG